MLALPVNALAGNPLDRASLRREDETWLEARLSDPTSQAVVLWNGEVLVEDAGAATRLAHPSVAQMQAVAPGEEPLLFLGMDEAVQPPRAVFAFDLDGPADPTAGPLGGQGRFAGLRELAVSLAAPEAAVAATAKAVFEWRRRHRFCSACGQPSRVAEAGWKRICTACQTPHFPRTDPVVIMLPVAGGRCLVGHNARFPQGRFSALAGFVEPGETLEEACARELKEEASLETRAVAYHSSQPWPFPSSLMVGLIAEVEAAEGQADLTELDEIRWLTRPEARAFLEGGIEGISAPPPFTIAHQLIRSWAGSGD